MLSRTDSSRSQNPLLTPDDAREPSDSDHLLLTLARGVVLLAWLLVSVQTVAMCLAYPARFSHIGAGTWSGVAVS